MSISSILFVCLGNICRSPLAEGVFRHEAGNRGLADRMTIDSAGTGGWHIGEPPDPRAIKTAAVHGIDLSGQTCRRLCEADFTGYELILCMDKSNLQNTLAAEPVGATAQIALFMEWAGLGDQEIPDPYYGGMEGYELAYQMICQASQGVLERIAA